MQPCISRSDGNIIFTKGKYLKKEIVYKMRCNTITCRFVTIKEIYIYICILRRLKTFKTVTQILNTVLSLMWKTEYEL